MLDSSDYYILISAGRYGSVDPITKLSYTEMEYDYACSKKISVMSFLFNSPEELPEEKRENEKERSEKLNKFRDKVKTGGLIKYFSDKDELLVNIAASLKYNFENNPASGWVRSDSKYVNTSLINAFDQYLKENRLTNEEIANIVNNAARQAGII